MANSVNRQNAHKLTTTLPLYRYFMFDTFLKYQSTYLINLFFNLHKKFIKNTANLCAPYLAKRASVSIYTNRFLADLAAPRRLRFIYIATYPYIHMYSQRELTLLGSAAAALNCYDCGYTTNQQLTSTHTLATHIFSTEACAICITLCACVCQLPACVKSAKCRKPLDSKISSITRANSHTHISLPYWHGGSPLVVP